MCCQTRESWYITLLVQQGVRLQTYKMKLENFCVLEDMSTRCWHKLLENLSSGYVFLLLPDWHTSVPVQHIQSLVCCVGPAWLQQKLLLQYPRSKGVWAYWQHHQATSECYAWCMSICHVTCLAQGNGRFLQPDLMLTATHQLAAPSFAPGCSLDHQIPIPHRSLYQQLTLDSSKRTHLFVWQ